MKKCRFGPGTHRNDNDTSWYHETWWFSHQASQRSPAWSWIWPTTKGDSIVSFPKGHRWTAMSFYVLLAIPVGMPINESDRFCRPHGNKFSSIITAWMFKIWIDIWGWVKTLYPWWTSK
jgi:hypothetical protein